METIVAEAPGEGPGAALRDGRGAGRGPCSGSSPTGRSGAAGLRRGAVLAVVQAESGGGGLMAAVFVLLAAVAGVASVGYVQTKRA